MTKQERLEHAQEVFGRVSPPRWTLSNTGVGQGAQSSVCAVTREDGVCGVFRCLPPSPTDLAIARFRREVKAVEVIDHPNVMRLLASDQDDPWWYISAMGQGFKDYWKDVVSNQNGEELAGEALSVVRQLALGLQECHSRGLVHRDIKPNNVVVSEGGVPVIIDFGIVWIDEEERLTAEGESLGNARYSPDILRRRSESCPPWVDVFSLVQMFQWMVSERDAKHYWQRPTHWKYVDYPMDLPSDFERGCRALGAVTTHEETCPQNGGELHNLLDRFFGSALNNHHPSTGKLSLEVQKAIAEGAHAKGIRETLDREILQASYQVAANFYDRLVEVLQPLASHEGVILRNSNKFSELYPEESSGGDHELLSFECGVDDTAKFTISVGIRAFVPSRWTKTMNRPDYLAGSNVFAFTISRMGPSSKFGGTFPAVQLHLTLERDGACVRRDQAWKKKEEEVSLEDIHSKIQDLILEPDAWQYVAKA